MRWLFVAALAACGHPSNAGVDSGDGLGGDGIMIDAPSGDAVIVPACPSGQWCVETVPPGVSGVLAAVFAANANDVFAVGDHGAILHRHDNTWATMTSNTTADLRGVWGASAMDVWAGGSGGALVHYDGSTWTASTSVTGSDINAIGGSATNDVWIVGTSLAKHWNGSAWSSPATVPGGTLLGLAGLSATDAWTTGEAASVRNYTGGATWGSAIVPINSVTTYYAIAADATNVWVATTGNTARLESSTWTPYTPSGGATFVSLSIAAPTNVWGVGNTQIGHWSGAWSIEAPPSVTQNLYGVATAGTDVFVVGAGAMILHRD